MTAPPLYRILWPLWLLLSVPGVSVFLSSPARADIYWESIQRVAGGGLPERTRIIRNYLTADKARMDIGENVMIADFAANQGYVLQKKDRMYLKMRLDQVGKIPEGLRAEQEISATGRRRKIGNYLCREFKIRFMKRGYTLWVSDKVPGYDELKKMDARLAGLMKANPLFRMSVIGLLDRLDGFPVLAVMPMENDRTKTILLRRVSRKPISPDRFRVPEGYRPPY